MEHWKENLAAALSEQVAEAKKAEVDAADQVARVQEDCRNQVQEAKRTHARVRKDRQKLESMIAQLTSTEQRVVKLDVVARIQRLLTDNPGGIPAEEFKALVQDSLRSDGYALTGAFRHWGKWLSEMEGLRLEGGVYRLNGVAGDFRKSVIHDS